MVKGNLFHDIKDKNSFKRNAPGPICQTAGQWNVDVLFHALAHLPFLLFWSLPWSE